MFQYFYIRTPLDHNILKYPNVLHTSSFIFLMNAVNFANTVLGASADK